MMKIKKIFLVLVILLLSMGLTNATDFIFDASIDAFYVDGGTIKLQDYSTCNVANEGYLKYDTSDNKVKYCDASSWQEMGSGSSGLWTDASPNIYRNSGNVGIGNTNPGYKLDVLGPNSDAVLNIQSTSGSIRFYPYSNDINYILSGNQAWSSSQLLMFEGASANPANFSFNGNIGVGTIVPAQALAVNGTLNVTADGTAGPNLFVASNGNVGIGTHDPQSELVVLGTIRTLEICDENGAKCWDVSTGMSGGISCPGGFTAVEKHGNTLGCIQNNEQGTNDCFDAIEDCWNTYGGRLPSFNELYIAQYEYALGGEGDGEEWVDGGSWHYHNDAALNFENNNCHIWDDSEIKAESGKQTDNADYRCWIPV